MLEADQYTLVVGSTRSTGSVSMLSEFAVVPGAFWATVTFGLPQDQGVEQRLVLDGIPNERAAELKAALAAALEAHRRKAVAALLRNFSRSLQPIVGWVQRTRQSCQEQLARRGWLGPAFVGQMKADKPMGLAELLGMPEAQQRLAKQAPELQDAVTFWTRPFQEVADGFNQGQLGTALAESKTFFDTVEKSPLTEEQAHAVVCFDDRVLLVASAGSGKTSTMVAKAGYALKQGYFAANRIVMLAFNKDAVAELRERIRARLEPLGLPASQVTAKTFHAFGLDVIGQATGMRPSLAPWVESGQDLAALLEMSDALKDSDPSFRTQWDLFRLVLAQDLGRFGKENDSPDSWSGELSKAGFRTLNDDVVKSRGELIIANWLFYNGVRYEYESPYRHATADPTHRQYRPDFYFPDADAYLEHWALDARGKPPPAFVGYEEGMVWKRQVHAQYGTRLLETTMAQLWSGQAFAHLATELAKLGIELDPNPDRGAAGQAPVESPRLARTFRSFLMHTKSNRLTMPELRARLDASPADTFRYRQTVFLDLFEQLWGAWEARLRSEQCIDFEDMLNISADCVEQGRWTSPYELVMVDEFQDASKARCRLVASLVKNPGTCLFAVGDDWQSINRYAGADLGVMTDFEAMFGATTTLKLQSTFRCVPSLCTITSAFIQKNPLQLRKEVMSPKQDLAEPVRVVRVPDEAGIRLAVQSCVEEIANAYSGRGRKPKVFVLGRYRRDAAQMPREFDAGRVDVEFLTVHGSKGLEADHVILPRVTSEVLGLPSRVTDDPVLQLAMSGADTYEFAEERRLFYVALTRSRATVTLISLEGRESPFLAELVKDFGIPIRDVDGAESSNEVCPSCGTGFFVPRKSQYGPFLGCSNFPACQGKRKVVTEAGPRSASRGGRRAAPGRGYPRAH